MRRFCNILEAIRERQKRQRKWKADLAGRKLQPAKGKGNGKAGVTTAQRNMMDGEALKTLRKKREALRA